MPAIRAFSLYAAVAVLVNFILQATVFVGVMVLDVRRQMVIYDHSEILTLRRTFIVPFTLIYFDFIQDGRYDVLCCTKSKYAYEYSTYKEFLYTFFNKYFTSGLLSTFVRPIVVRHKHFC